MGGSRLYPIGSTFPTGGKLYVKFCDPIYPKDFKEHNELREHTRNVFKQQYEYKKD